MVAFSVLIITHGREELLLKCLDSLRPPSEDWQLILVANGRPLSIEITKRARSLTNDVEILDLAQLETPGKARNLGLNLVKHDWVFFIDDDAYVLPNYFETLLPLLHDHRIDVLGGPDTAAKDMDSFSQALAIALASPFCTGQTFGRHSRKGRHLIAAKENSLTSCNLWIRTKLLKNISFPENYLRTEETALLLDLEQRGANLFYHPDLVVAHYRRKTLKSLIHPTFFAGYFRSKVLKEKSPRGGILYWLPALFVMLHFLILIYPPLFWMLMRMYLGLVVMMSLNMASRSRKIQLFGHVTVLHYVIVFFYGLGFLSHRLGFQTIE